MVKISEIVAAVKLGAPLETVIPTGSDLAYWQRLVNRALANEAKPKRRKSSRRSSYGRNSHRHSAAAVLARLTGLALAELTERTNSKKEAHDGHHSLL